MAGRLHRVDVGPQKKKFPAVFFRPEPNHFPDLPGRIASAGVFHTIGDNDKKGMFRHVLRPGISMDVPNMTDSSAHGIQQSGTAANHIILSCDGLHLAQIHTIVKHLAPIVEKKRGDQSFPGFFLLLFQHGTKPSDGVVLHPLHGAAPVQDEYQFRQILFHEQIPLSCVAAYNHRIGGFDLCLVA